MRQLIAVLLVGLLPTASQAQDPPQRIENLGLACCTVRIWANNGQAQGTFQGLVGSTSRIMLFPCKGNLCPKPDGIDSTIVLQKNTAIEIYAGRSVEKGVKWGAALGGLALTGYWLAKGDEEQEDAGKIGAGMVIGGVVGAVVGGLIGALFPRWAPVIR